MSHHPPGLKRFLNTHQYEIPIQVKNFGQTPATITKIVIKDVIKDVIIPSNNPLPDIPDYTTKQRCTNIDSRIFLVRDDEFSCFHPIPILGLDMEKIKRRSVTLYVYGYVDYIDQFGTRHRAGYGRRYDPRFTQNNLYYITQPGYNYDRPRQQAQGQDWETHV